MLLLIEVTTLLTLFYVVELCIARRKRNTAGKRRLEVYLSKYNR